MPYTKFHCSCVYWDSEMKIFQVFLSYTDMNSILANEPEPFHRMSYESLKSNLGENVSYGRQLMDDRQ